MKKLYFIGALFSATSCAVTGLTNDYSDLNVAQKSRIVEVANFHELDTTKIYKVTARQLLDEVSKDKKSLVYVFTNGCKGKSCEPLVIYENYAKTHGYRLYLVMDGYGHIEETLAQPRASNLYSINSDFYNSKYRSVYSRLFMNELRGKPAENNMYEGSFVYFTNGSYVKTTRALIQ